jgi:hypothetical protein
MKNVEQNYMQVHNFIYAIANISSTNDLVLYDCKTLLENADSSEAGEILRARSRQAAQKFREQLDLGPCTFVMLSRLHQPSLESGLLFAYALRSTPSDASDTPQSIRLLFVFEDHPLHDSWAQEYHQ